MACCLRAPSHYLNQCWLIINRVLWPSHKTNLAGSAQDINSSMTLKHTLVNILSHLPSPPELTHHGRVMHICVSKQIIIGSDNGLSPYRRQTIIWTNAGLLLIGPLGTNFSEILIEILTFSFKKMHLKMSSGKWQTFCLGLNVLKTTDL